MGRDHCYYTGKFRGATHNICNLRCKTLKETSVVFHNGSTYVYHFIINQLAKEFDSQLECLGKNTEKYITFSVPIKKELNDGKTSTYKLRFIDSFRFMSTLLSSLAHNLSGFTTENVDIKAVNLTVILLRLKIVNYITNATNVK